MRVHFVTVTEKTGKYFNMAKLLLYSFRKNAGIYKNAPFTIVFSGSGMPENELAALQNRFSPLHVRVMPRLSPALHMIKFNAYYVVDESAFDVLVYLDSDMVVLNPLDGIAAGMDGDGLFFKAGRIGLAGGVVLGYETLLKKYAGLTEAELKLHRDASFIPGYPLFNGGMQVITQKALIAMREDAVRISYDLYNRGTPNSLKGLIELQCHNLLFKKLLTMKRRGRSGGYVESIMRSLARAHNNAFYPIWSSEQLGLTLSVLKNKIPFEVLDRKFNFPTLLKDGNLPAVLHYFQETYNFDRNHLFDGEWISDYSNSASPVKKALAELVQSYNSDEHSLSA